MSEQEQGSGGDPTDPRETLRGTFVSVLFIGAFCLVLWLLFFVIYIRQA
ncbi:MULTISPECIES: cytochrome c oxidase subunit 2A [Paenibacillus]|nr:cytochrome c oxidase subunit 2A [Paenibacillus caseinilyticus]MCZ8521011.1 cytochrome c oxidase subunit 2A [Paenibacillus caseinilyticus]